MSRLLFLDLETTGFSTQYNCILEIAAEIVDENYNICAQFHQYIKPRNRIPASVVELTRITDDMVKDCRSEKEVLMDFSEWICTHEFDTVIGHNCKAFDLRFLRERCAYNNVNWNLGNATIVDTLSLAKQLGKQNKITVLNFRQPTLAAYFSIKYEAHSAIEDIHALQQIYKHLKKFEQPTTRAMLGF